MVDALALAVLVVVSALLIIGLIRQFAVSSRFWLTLDRLGIVPQWKFFAQARAASDPSRFDDMHLLARFDDGGDIPGPWSELLWWETRPLLSALWNPHDRSRSAIGECMDLLAITETSPGTAARPTALAYLTVLRHCLDSARGGPDELLQFAIVLTRGRTDRPLALRFLSAWHCP